MEIEFFAPTETPELVRKSERGLSVDVLIWIETLSERAVGFYNYNTSKWQLITGDNTKMNYQIWYWLTKNATTTKDLNH